MAFFFVFASTIRLKNSNAIKSFKFQEVDTSAEVCSRHSVFLIAPPIFIFFMKQKIPSQQFQCKMVTKNLSTHFRLLNATLKGWYLAKSVLCKPKILPKDFLEKGDGITTLYPFIRHLWTSVSFLLIFPNELLFH